MGYVVDLIACQLARDGQQQIMERRWSPGTGHFLEVVFSGGSGYSDMHLLPSPEAGDLIGVAFQKCDDVHQRQTSGMSMGWALVRVPPHPGQGK